MSPHTRQSGKFVSDQPADDNFRFFLKIIRKRAKIARPTAEIRPATLGKGQHAGAGAQLHDRGHANISIEDRAPYKVKST
jgi:hypothetical protein